MFVDRMMSETKSVPFPDPATTWKSLLSAELANGAYWDRVTSALWFGNFRRANADRVVFGPK
jgi:hypothetical protein